MLDLSFSKCVRALSFLFLLSQATTAIAQNIVHVRDYGNEAYQRCNRMHNTFVFNKANVNVLVAMACTSRSHGEADTKMRTYDNSATMFHQWTTTNAAANEIHVEGFCSVPLGQMRRGELDRYKIDFTLSKVQKGKDYVYVPSGAIAGIRPTLEFNAPRSTDGFLDNHCARGENRVNSLNIGMGLSPMAMASNLLSIFKSGHGTSRLNLREVESWTQGNSSVGMSGVGMQYEMANITDPRGSAGMTVSASTEVNLHIRSAYDSNIFDDSWFALNVDDYGMPTGFATTSGGNNSEFEAYPIQGGSSMIGCTSLVYDDPRTGKPSPADINNCKNYIRNSPLGKFTAQEYISQEKELMRKEDLANIANAVFNRKIDDYLKANNAAPAKRYCKPNVAATGCARWTATDKARGYVVIQRNFLTDEASARVNVTEFRMGLNGATSQKKYFIRIESL